MASPSEYSTSKPVPGSGSVAASAGNVIGSLPLGFVSPKSTEASALPFSWPGYQAATTPATESSHGMRTAPGVFKTTMVRGFASAMASMSAFCSLESAREVRSVNSLDATATTTIATSELAATVAAVAGSDSPGEYDSVLAWPTSEIASNGLTMYGAVTSADPPPPDNGAVSAGVPNTAIAMPLFSIGSARFSFLSRVMPEVAPSSATATCSAVLTVPPESTGGSSTTPTRTSEVTTRVAIRSTRADSLENVVLPKKLAV